MEYYIIMCRSLTYAQRAVRLAEKSGYYAGLIKLPQHLTPEGCSYGVKVRARDVDAVRRRIAASGIKVGKLFAVDREGELREVVL